MQDEFQILGSDTNTELRKLVAGDCLVGCGRWDVVGAVWWVGQRPQPPVPPRVDLPHSSWG